MDAANLALLKSELLRLEPLSPAEREPHLAELARTHPEVERELRSLFEQEPLPETPRSEGGRPIDAPGSTSTTALRQLGPYRLIEVLGVGGMGIVYRAEQQEPLKREVAIKLLRGGLDSARILARFAAERRAMAALEHPAIARILDAGLDVDGMPYLVTELVRGAPLSEYCRGRQLPAPQVIRLCVEVCRAVQYAHQKGIIHRDLKPSNILVEEIDGVPHPKIIDFGIARILEQEEGAAPGLTIEGQVVGTLGYMSPEQAAGRPDAVDTRSDVYSLGALVYELLTGALPHDLEGANASSALEIIARDSARPFHTVLVKRQTLDGDLEQVVLKALEREPERRYDSAGAFADDLERWLRHEAILARPPSATYVLRKLIRRHRASFTLAAVALVFVAGVAVAMSVLYAQQVRERARAEREARKATEISTFLKTMLSSVNPRVKRPDVQVREVMGDAAKQLDFGAIQDPEVEASLRVTLAEGYDALGADRETEAQITRAIELRRAALGERHPLVAECLLDIVTQNIGRFGEPGRVEAADSLCRRAMDILGDSPGESSFDFGRSLYLMARILVYRHQYAAAESVARRAIDFFDRAAGEKNTLLRVYCHQVLGTILVSLHRPDEADSAFERAIQIARARRAGDDPELAQAMGRRSEFLTRNRGNLEVADSLAAAAFAMQRRLWGAHHPRVAMALYRLGRTRLEEGRTSQAESLYQAAFQIDTTFKGSGTVDEVRARAWLGFAQLNSGNDAGAEHNLVRAIDLARQLHADSLDLGEALRSLGNLRHKTGRCDLAQRAYREGILVNERFWGVDHERVAALCYDLSTCLVRQGSINEVEPYLRRALTIFEGVYSEGHPWVAASMGSLGELYMQEDRLGEAEVQCRKAVVMTAELEGAGSWSRVHRNAVVNLGICLYLEGQIADADSLLRKADGEWRSRGPLKGPDYARLQANLGSVLLDRGAVREADSILAASVRELTLAARRGSWGNWLWWTRNALATARAVEGRQAAADSLFRLSGDPSKHKEGMPPAARRIAERRYKKFRSTVVGIGIPDPPGDQPLPRGGGAARSPAVTGRRLTRRPVAA